MTREASKASKAGKGRSHDEHRAPAASGKHRIHTLRDELLTAQSQLIDEKCFALAIVVTGMPTAGRSEVVNQFLEWLDAKHIKVHALKPLGSDCESGPPLARYWATLPRRGEIAIYFKGWYEDYLAAASSSSRKARRSLPRIVERIRQLETMLHFDRVRVLKLDLSIDRTTQRQRIQTLRANKATRWRVTREDRWIAKHYKRMRKVTERMIQSTDSPLARWHRVDGADPERRQFTAGMRVLKELQAGLHSEGRPRIAVPRPAPVKLPKRAFPTRGPDIDEDTYQHRLEALQGRLALLTRKRAFARHSVVLVLEGLDAAGKGGAIRRLTAALDARQYNVIPVSAPTPEEQARPYLWRFWRDLPERGEFAIFDRSWYGRVLVERVRGLTAPADWQRAYQEINEFERQLTESGIIVRKFWLALSKQEQLQRLERRQRERLKRYKVDAEDWVNRRHFDAYQRAAQEMVARTDSDDAPWVIVAADNKKYARLKVLQSVCEALETAFDR